MWLIVIVGLWLVLFGIVGLYPATLICWFILASTWLVRRHRERALRNLSQCYDLEGNFHPITKSK